jgi:two-component system, LuxR family, sensor kinase FixL
MNELANTQATLASRQLEDDRRYQELFEVSRDPMYVYDEATLNFLMVNPAATRLYGYSREEFLRMNLKDIRAKSEMALLYKALTEQRRFILAHGGAWRHRKKDGTLITVDLTVSAITFQGRPARLVLACDITEQKRAEEALGKMRERLETEILAISEREQRRMGQDLHDDICQQLAGIEFLSKALEQQLGTSVQASQAGEIAKLIREVIEDTRRLARGLAPIQLEAEGLMEALRALAARTGHLFGIECDFQCPAPTLIHDVSVGTCLYRIAQEAVSNAIRHGRAHTIRIVLKPLNPGVELEIANDGVGFPDKSLNPTGMGLRIMQYRTDLIRGELRILKAPDGTRVICTAPLRRGRKAKP